MSDRILAAADQAAQAALFDLKVEHAETIRKLALHEDAQVAIARAVLGETA